MKEKKGKPEPASSLPGEGTPDQGWVSREELVITIARELYDRFVMGGWEPQDAYPQIREMLGFPPSG